MAFLRLFFALAEMREADAGVDDSDFLEALLDVEDEEDLGFDVEAETAEIRLAVLATMVSDAFRAKLSCLGK